MFRSLRVSVKGQEEKTTCYPFHPIWVVDSVICVIMPWRSLHNSTHHLCYGNYTSRLIKSVMVITHHYSSYVLWSLHITTHHMCNDTPSTQLVFVRGPVAHAYLQQRTPCGPILQRSINTLVISIWNKFSDYNCNARTFANPRHPLEPKRAWSTAQGQLFRNFNKDSTII